MARGSHSNQEDALVTWCNQLGLSHCSSSRVDCQAHSAKGLKALDLGRHSHASPRHCCPLQELTGSCPAPGTACPQAQLALAMPPASHRCLGLLVRSSSWPLPAPECCPVPPEHTIPTPLSESHKPHTDQDPWKQPCVSHELQESSVPSPQHFLRQLPNTTGAPGLPLLPHMGPCPSHQGGHTPGQPACDRAAVSVPPAAEPSLLPCPAMLGHPAPCPVVSGPALPQQFIPKSI